MYSFGYGNFEENDGNMEYQFLFDSTAINGPKFVNESSSLVWGEKTSQTQ
jgi:hypothetical protein